MLHGKRILLIIGGGIAAYKSLELIRRLQDEGARLRCILTSAGAQFVTPLAVSSLSQDKCYMDLFSLTDEAEMGHIRLSREADLVLVAPATADLMAKMAHGLANDLASTALLATDKPVMIAPAMNVEMWAHPATRRNRAMLEADGVSFVGPASGLMACGEIGAGRLSEVQEILAAVKSFFSGPKGLPLSGLHALVTAGPTQEQIDPVRYIANRSSGKQGFAIAGALAALGARVTLVSGPVGLETPKGVERIDVVSADEMLAASLAALPADMALCVAAVADWKVVGAGVQKIKKTDDGKAPVLQFAENPDILATLSGLGADRPKLMVGFAAETEKLLAHAEAKRQRKGCDWIVANDVSYGSGVMGGDENAITLISDAGTERWEQTSKHAIAQRLALRIADHFQKSPSGEAAESRAEIH
ncbi:phosphopantothenate synthase [Iodidimonas nitroreducens]|uniref:Coenzyme A biosynthesis bifunctional protein CoaBC n=1 Tax=Iodidimonas nitroreducens TaxID=1236968 RepID=A0A5A7N5E1_9PROT|nr:bifunctional phosphopantothenoylcysteine decarboxylase/phosphopantothenate--cysteine ligase CoaBC [Iodidimonas nitroreducens]GAK32201.1 coenzyme A biosynthesis bifunctional protein CoaBC [alpha proteobacterium Q-1]GER02630.1 phosphopantothenate synthase [Iodidimonas nitroreducens]